jgi:branched-chain amino acid transport system permease protein
MDKTTIQTESNSILEINRSLSTSTQKMSLRILPTWKILLFVSCALGIIPFLVNGYLLSVLVIIGFYSISTIGVTLVMGYGGLVTLAQAAFWGVGAYMSAIISSAYSIHPFVSIPLSMAITGLTAYAIGRLTIRLQGHHFSLATLGFGIVINIILMEQSDWTGGPSGMMDIPGIAIGSWTLSGDTGWYYTIWIAALCCIFLLDNLLNTAWGRNLRAMHTSQTAAEAMGVQTTRYRLQAFVISAVLAGLSGALYSHYMGFISPALFSFEMSIEFLVMAVLGGLGAIWGGLLGAIVVTLLVEVLRAGLPALLSEQSSGGAVEVIFFGLLLMIMMIFMPKGLVGMLQSMWMKWRKE